MKSSSHIKLNHCDSNYIPRQFDCCHGNRFAVAAWLGVKLLNYGQSSLLIYRQSLSIKLMQQVIPRNITRVSQE